MPYGLLRNNSRRVHKISESKYNRSVFIVIFSPSLSMVFTFVFRPAQYFSNVLCIVLLFPAWKFNHIGTNDFETKKLQHIISWCIRSVSQSMQTNARCQSRSHINTRRISYLLSNLPHKILPYLFRLIYIVWSVSSLWLLWLSEHTVGVAWCTVYRQPGKQAHTMCVRQLQRSRKKRP